MTMTTLSAATTETEKNKSGENSIKNMHKQKVLHTKSRYKWKVDKRVTTLLEASFQYVKSKRFIHLQNND